MLFCKYLLLETKVLFFNTRVKIQLKVFLSFNKCLIAFLYIHVDFTKNRDIMPNFLNKIWRGYDLLLSQCNYNNKVANKVKSFILKLIVISTELKYYSCTIFLITQV